MAGNTKQVYVIDASFLLAYLLPDEEVNSVQSFFDRYKQQNIELLAPNLLPFEILNGLKANILQRRLDYETAIGLAKRFLKLPINFQEVNFLKTFELVSSNKLTFYDASYLYLSQAQNAPLLTLDKKLQRLCS